jgi:hypothetical protein
VGLKLVKNVSGGGSTPAQWILTADGPTGSARLQQVRATTPRSTVWANTEYTLAETAPAGETGNYDPRLWTCDNNISVTNGKITIPAGTPNVTCEITNTRKTTKIKLVKNVSGGGSTPVEWTLKADGPTGSPSYSKPGNHPNFETIWANADYTLSETAPAGQSNSYDPSLWTCDKGVTVTAGKINIPAATQDVTCQITNTRVYAGTEYTLSETGPNNYTAGSWQCTGTGVTQNGNKVTVAKNGEVTCEITNTRDLAKLAVVKKVEGGASVPADFKLSAKAAAPNDGKNIVDRAGNISTLAEVYAGTEYTLSETGPANIQPCRQLAVHRHRSHGRTATRTSSWSPHGEETRCSITNSRDLAKLAVVKEVEGGDQRCRPTSSCRPRPQPPTTDKDIVDRAGNVSTLADGLRRHRVHPVGDRPGQLQPDRRAGSVRTRTSSRCHRHRTATRSRVAKNGEVTCDR